MRSIVYVAAALSMALPLFSTATAQNTIHFDVTAPTILSDTHGYDFGQYLPQLTNQVRNKWYSVIPDSARFGRRGRVTLSFSIARNGRVQNLRALAGSGAQALDKAATDAVQKASPLPELPADFSDSQIVVQLTFLYNES